MQHIIDLNETEWGRAYLWEAFTCQPLQDIVIRCSCIRCRLILSAEGSSQNYGKCSIRLYMTKSNFRETTQPWIYSKKFLIISKDTFISRQLYFKKATEELSSRVLRSIWFMNLLYITVEKIFKHLFICPIFLT